MAECKECLYYDVCADFRRNICETDQRRFEEYKINSNGICDIFKNKADYAEVKHGYWRKHPLANGVVCCSECGYVRDCRAGNSCPECGTKMDGR